MEQDLILNGVHIGEHSFVQEKIIDEIKERCLDCGSNYVVLRPGENVTDSQYYIKYAKFLAENKVYFQFAYMTQHPPKGRESRFEPEIVEEIKKVAGEYFLGEALGEIGTESCCSLPGYFVENGKTISEIYPQPQLKCMRENCEYLVERIKKMVEINRSMGVEIISACDATMLTKYNLQGGVSIPLIEMPVITPDIHIASLRGAAYGYSCKLWGTYIAHEWYGGLRHTDPLKRKRLELTYKYAYMSGSNSFMIESGEESIASFGDTYDKDSEICGDYRRATSYMSKFIKEDFRPAGGPKVSVGFVSGNYDAYGGNWGGSSLWNQFFKKEFGHNEAEYSWRMLDEVYQKRIWSDIANYGEYDFSSAPAWGTYDIVPIEVPAEKLFRYDYLIFMGYNSMTEEIMDKLIAYVKNGGHLLMSAAHLNTSTKHEGEFEFVSNDKIEQLFGCRYFGQIVNTNYGHKFVGESFNKNVLYPSTKNLTWDPLCSAGYLDYARFIVIDGEIRAQLSCGFSAASDTEIIPSVVENKLGKGVATLVTSTNYPGNGALYPLYRVIMRELLTASARSCPIKVISSDRLRYTVYEGGKMYLLNTDYDLPITAKIITGGEEQIITLEPLELKTLELDRSTLL